MLKTLTALTVLGTAAMSTPAEARRGSASSVITVDNDQYGSVKVFVDGRYLGHVRGGRQVDLYVSPGTHAVRIVQSRFDCVLSADILDLPRMSRVQYEIDRRCGPERYGRGHGHAYGHYKGRGPASRWNNPDVHWTIGRYTPVVPDPVYVNVQQHFGTIRAPLVLTHGPRVASTHRGWDRHGHHDKGRWSDGYGHHDRRRDHDRDDDRYDDDRHDDRHEDRYDDRNHRDDRDGRGDDRCDRDSRGDDRDSRGDDGRRGSGDRGRAPRRD